MAKQETLTFTKFQQRFDSEKACHDHLFQLKWSNGFCCPNCQHHEYFEISIRTLPLFQCKKCNHQTTVTVGTIFEKTRTPLRKWFTVIYWEAQDKRGVSAVFVARELEVSYPTAWLMLHKIRKAMADRDEGYVLSGLVEIDDFYIGAPTENGKRGRGTDKNQVLVALSKNEKGHPLYVKMEVIVDMKRETVETFVKENIETNSTLIADGHRTIPTLKDNYTIEAKKYNAKEDPEHLKWVHTLISNLKSFVLGTFHGLDSRHLQSYLDEFSVKHPYCGHCTSYSISIVELL
ncbi:IS1595 family transposase [Paenibacillus alkaliterrae]|uniref:IS1595 family transposase n=1 Tax=Paenibacillus alkaliterrae TaxID=320909 RepID=UPI001F2E417F|nr:IS1595 family transposase [Paenibacillus alkaliterrae]MCF2941602.1 IS1595 family transposase [Paenibacillus alkaliterrae]